jgi:hypothetical protein
MRFLNVLHWLWVSSGVTTLLGAITFVLRAKVSLGYWPYYNNPDPSELNFEIHRHFIICAFLGFLLSHVYILVFSVVRIASRKSWPIRETLLIILSDIMIFLFVRFNFLGFWVWFID